MRFLSLLFVMLAWSVSYLYIDIVIENSDLSGNDEYDSFQGKCELFFLWAGGEYKYKDVEHSDKWNTSYEENLKSNDVNINRTFYPIFIIIVGSICGLLLRDSSEGILFGLFFGLFFIVTGYIGLGDSDIATPIAEDTLIYGVGFPMLVGLCFNKLFSIIIKK